MGKLIFKYGTMGSGKTAECLMKIYHERSKGNKVLVCKPSLDKRQDTIKSRIGLETKVDINEKKLCRFLNCEYDFIIIDEAQFIAPGWIFYLREIASKNKTDIICYGLKTDFKGNLFEGSKKLLEFSDEIIEIESSCKQCNNKAIFNMKLLNGKPIFTGKSIDCGGDEKYIAVCSSCYMKELYKNTKERKENE